MTTSQLERALQVMDALAAAGGVLRYGEIQQQLDGLNVASLNRLLRAMCTEELIRHVHGGYEIGGRARSWVDALPVEVSLKDAMADEMQRISETHEATVMLLQRQGQRVEAVAKWVHEHAPALMPIGSRFTPRLPYFGCICFVSPPKQGITDWLKKQLSEVDSAVRKRRAEARRVVTYYQAHGYYRDDELYPGQLRMALPITRGGQCHAVLGAVTLVANTSQRQEKLLYADLLHCVEQCSERL